MSFIPLGTSVAAAAALNLVQAVLIRPRNIAGFVANVTVEEHHEDEVVITETPIEQGAAVTDHAYKRPARVTLRCGWSNSSLQGIFSPNNVFAAIAGNSPGDYVQQVYNQFLILQASLVPFQIITGKRIYDNMLARRVSTTTTEATENALFLTIECQQVIVVTTQVVTVPPASSMKSPAANAPVNPVGQQGLAPAPHYVPFGG